jgi:hypothetical protein
MERDQTMSSYDYFQNIVLAIVAIGAWLVIGVALNLVGVQFNVIFISMGASVQSAETLGNTFWVFGSFPIIFIVGWYLNGIVRASESRNMGYSSGNQSFGAGTFFLLTAYVLAILLSFAGGLMVDSLEHKVMNVVTLPLVWQSAQTSLTPIFVNMLYFFVYFIEGIGIFLFFQSIFPRSTGAQYQYGGY